MIFSGMNVDLAHDTLFCVLPNGNFVPFLSFFFVSKSSSADLSDHPDKPKSNAKKCVLLIEGDFNLPDINWRDLTISSTQYPSRLNKTFLDIVADNSLEQIIDFPTRKDNTLDLILTSHPSFRDVSQCHQ